MRFIIHACKEREWYVDEFLVPSLLEQGIPSENITIWMDRRGVGCLESTMQNFYDLPIINSDGSRNCCHLQDDVLISRDFYTRIQEFNNYNGIVNCIATKYDRRKKDFVNNEDDDFSHLWFSFPCIIIPNITAKSCAYYYYDHQDDIDLFRKKTEQKRGDDVIFRNYIKKCCSGLKFINLKPNLVQHIDYMINGSTLECKKGTGKKYRSLYFDDIELEDKLEQKIKERNNKKERE